MSIKLIPLTQGKFAIVDAADYEWLNQWKWFAVKPKKDNKSWYAQRSLWEDGRVKTVQMHCQIMGSVNGIKVDHKDGNGLNNSRANLRYATNSQNKCNMGPRSDNKSGYKGVSWDNNKAKWKASIKINGKTITIGRFNAPDAASSAYQKAALKYHGEYARTESFRGN